MRQLPSGFWVATDDPSRGEPVVVSHRAGRPAVAGPPCSFGELSIITERGRIRCQARSKRPQRTPHARELMSLHDFNWAEPNSGEVLLRLWDARHGLQPGDFIEIDRDVGRPRKATSIGAVTLPKSRATWCTWAKPNCGAYPSLGAVRVMPNVGGSKQ